MSKIVVTEFLSLDGVMENPMWSAPYWNDEVAQFKGEEMTNTDALLLGRVTYEGFAAAWPESKDQGAPRMNSITKYVVSTTLNKVEWNNSHLIKNNIVEELTKLKQQDGHDMLVYGSAALIRTLMQHDLVDSYRLLVYPVVLGTGLRLFPEGVPAKLKLVSAKPLGSDVVAMIYEPNRAS